MSYQTITFEIDGPIARLMLNRPDAANAMNPEMVKEFVEVAEICRDDPSVRVLLWTAPEGKIFCAGGDLAGFSEAGDALPEEIYNMAEVLHAALEIFSTMDAPVVMAIGGFAAGAGISLAAMASYVIASDDARFTMAYTNAGLTPDGSSTYFLPRLIGVRRTEELMITNRILDAVEARDWGIINEVVPGAELLARAEAVAEKMAQGATKAYGAGRRLLLSAFDHDLHRQLNEESKSISDMTRTKDAKEGISAFLEKRKPKFQGK